jgi:hypothetical protein
MLGFEPGAGDDLDELESQGHGRVDLRSRLGEGCEGLTPVGGRAGGTRRGRCGGRAGRGGVRTVLGHEAIFSSDGDTGRGDLGAGSALFLLLRNAAPVGTGPESGLRGW